MEELKKIIAVFIKKDPSDINNNTLINNAVISGSILIHRMYAAINKDGYTIKEYNDINTFGELLDRLKLNSDNTTYSIDNQTKILQPIVNSESLAGASGIDIETIANFPVVTDYREDSFYKLNFSMNEISHCILKENPIASFAGLFSAKEALCKANNDLRKIPFNQIEIKHDENGKPSFPGFSISISHNEQFSVAIAIAGQLAVPQKTILPDNNQSLQNTSFDGYGRKIRFLERSIYILFVITVILGIALLYLLFK